MHVRYVAEVVAPVTTGFVCDSFRTFIDAVAKVATIDRAACRAHVETRFSAATMASEYTKLYAMLASMT